MSGGPSSQRAALLVVLLAGSAWVAVPQTNGACWAILLRLTRWRACIMGWPDCETAFACRCHHPLHLHQAGPPAAGGSPPPPIQVLDVGAYQYSLWGGNNVNTGIWTGYLVSGPLFTFQQ